MKLNKAIPKVDFRHKLNIRLQRYKCLSCDVKLIFIFVIGEIKIVTSCNRESNISIVLSSELMERRVIVLFEKKPICVVVIG